MLFYLVSLCAALPFLPLMSSMEHAPIPETRSILVSGFKSHEFAGSNQRVTLMDSQNSIAQLDAIQRNEGRIVTRLAPAMTPKPVKTGVLAKLIQRFGSRASNGRSRATAELLVERSDSVSSRPFLSNQQSS
jgi:hypothetical protein